MASTTELNNTAVGKDPERAAAIYVESEIAAPIDEVWRRTQDPGLHQRWDVRFTSIDGLDDPGDGPRRFRYVTSIGPGLHIDGWGRTARERRRPDGTASSTLEFGSDHPFSLIAHGAGFWRYVPTARGVRFLTRFDYTVRWGRAGRLLDRAFRPLFGWGTAWSFDRLRLWIERGICPERSRNQTVLHVVTVGALAAGAATSGVGSGPIGGMAGIAIGLAVLRWWRRPWPYVLAALAGAVLAIADRSAIGVAAIVLGVLALRTRRHLPSGSRPLRAPRRVEVAP